MNELLAQLLQQGQALLLTGFIILLRVGGIAALAPGFGETALPARIKTVAALGLTVLLIPPLSDTLAPLGAREGVPIWLLSEVATGLFLGLGLRSFVFALQVAGTVAAQSTSLSQLLGGSAGEPQPAIGNLMVVAGIALLMQIGLPVHLVEFILGSYQALPPGEWPNATALHEWGLGGIAHAFALAFMIAAPFVITGLIYNVALGAINRAMPQLMVAFVGAPALTAAGLILLAIALPAGLILWRENVLMFFANPFGVQP